MTTLGLVRLRSHRLKRVVMWCSLHDLIEVHPLRLFHNHHLRNDDLGIPVGQVIHSMRPVAFIDDVVGAHVRPVGHVHTFVDSHHRCINGNDYRRERKREPPLHDSFTGADELHTAAQAQRGYGKD
jgi:hypothetical protein